MCTWHEEGKTQGMARTQKILSNWSPTAEMQASAPRAGFSIGTRWDNICLYSHKVFFNVGLSGFLALYDNKIYSISQV